MRLERGPFRTLEGEWTLQPMGDVGCTVTLRLRFEFDSRLTGLMLTPVIEQTASSLVDAFVARAREINARESSGADGGYAGPQGRSDRDDANDAADGGGGGDGGGGD
jgi:hypothetical protein